MNLGKDKRADDSRSDAGRVLYKKDFWRTENLRYTAPHSRMVKVARTANSLAGEGGCTLLDVGCGPAALASLLRPNIQYYGVDIAIKTSAPNLLEADLMESPIGFGGKRFDIVVAQGFFEYVGELQSQKLAEIADILGSDGTFITSYVNFGHRQPYIYQPYSNVQPFGQFRASVEEYFAVRRVLPTSYNWRHWDSNHRISRTIGLHTDVNIPVVGRLFAVQYILVCGTRGLAAETGPPNVSGKCYQGSGTRPSGARRAACSYRAVHENRAT
jgi:SAM-dependent methyltransferase